MVTEKLKPCPFCGGGMRIIPGTECSPSSKRQSKLYRPQCRNCGAGLGGFKTEAEAITAWNTRAQSTPAPPEVGELVERLMTIDPYAREKDGHGPAAAVAAMREAAAAISGGWRSIETAAKEHGKLILAPNRYGKITDVFWNATIGEWDDGVYGAGIPSYNPKVWMPMPALPAQGEQG